jgi:hypothetical protein
MLFSKQPFFCLSRTAFNQSRMAGKDARQTAIRGSGRHFNPPEFWLFLIIEGYFERFMVERIFRWLHDWCNPSVLVSGRVFYRMNTINVRI